MYTRSRRFPSLAALSLAISAVAACTASPDDGADVNGSVDEELRALAPSEVVGDLREGASIEVSYSETPRYRALRVAADAADTIDVSVRAKSPTVTLPDDLRDVARLVERWTHDPHEGLPLTDEDDDDWPPGPGFVTVAEHGCGVFDVIVVTGEQRGRMCAASSGSSTGTSAGSTSRSRASRPYASELDRLLRARGDARGACLAGIRTRNEDAGLGHRLIDDGTSRTLLVRLAA